MSMLSMLSIEEIFYKFIQNKFTYLYKFIFDYTINNINKLDMHCIVLHN
jgi:hypothetical protein